MLRNAGIAISLFALWLLMSGVFKPLVVILGAASSILAVYILRRMDDAADSERLHIGLRPLALFRYCIWLLIEIAKANWQVTKIILAPRMGLNQHFFKVPYTQKTDLAQTIFANSITLTPGTISVEVEKGHFWVHAVSYSEDDHEALAEMDQNVSQTEAA